MSGPAARRGNRTWRPWLIPAAAAASVVLVIGLVVALTSAVRPGAAHQTSAGTASATATAAHPAYVATLVNPFYLHTRGQAYTVVYSTSDGDVVAKVPNPVVAGWTVTSDRVTAAPDDRTFYVEYDAIHGKPEAPNKEQIWIYTFHLIGTGSVTPLTRVDGGVISGCAGANNGESLIASPDGTKLVLTANVGCWIMPGYADEIITLDLATGHHAEWQGGLYKQGKILTIPTLSWSADSKSVTYLALWCNPPGGINPCIGTSGQDGYRSTQVRSLAVSATTDGGSLAQSRLLLTQSARFPVIVAAYAGPSDSELTMMVLSGHVNAAGGWSELTVERVSAVTGAVLDVEYRTTHFQGREAQAAWIELSPDPSGNHLLLSYYTTSPAGFVTGWISGGKFHLLPIRQPYPAYPASLISTW